VNKLKDKAVSLEYLKYELNGNILHCPILIDEALGAEARDVILFHRRMCCTVRSGLDILSPML